ncbi:hypothetical protein C8J57DRAFT_1475202 [Mycena rebaudengoi]|nr:hypothetical protein C8J57DRAFT_1475202 [Mycena rebaudengoi]
MAPVDDLGTQHPAGVPYSIINSSAAAARNISLSFIQALGFGAPPTKLTATTVRTPRCRTHPVHLVARFTRSPSFSAADSVCAVRTRNNTTSAHRYYIGVSPFDAEVFVAPLLYMYPPPEVGGLGRRDRRGTQLNRVVLGREGGNTAMYRVGSPTSDDRYKESLAKNAENSAAAADKPFFARKCACFVRIYGTEGTLVVIEPHFDV